MCKHYGLVSLVTNIHSIEITATDVETAILENHFFSRKSNSYLSWYKKSVLLFRHMAQFGIISSKLDKFIESMLSHYESFDFLAA